MKYVLNHEGKPYYKYFEDISAIPRVSFNEKGISDYLVQFAKDRGLWWYRDDLWNVIIKKPASPGYEDHPTVMVQGHTDLVGEKAPDSNFNFDTDPLELYVEDGWLKAKDTTLGADCGHGVAYMLALLDDNTLQHPPLEFFFSVLEEAGIGGPRHIDYSLFSAKKLINTDVMFEGATYVSTANVVGGDFIKRVSMVKNSKPAFAVKVAGLYGGHAAMNMYREQACAIKVAARVLYHFMKEVKINLASITGGTIRNNIAEECAAVFTCEEKYFDRMKEIADAVMAEAKAEHAVSDPGLYITLNPVDSPEEAMDDISSKGVIDLLNVLPSGTYMRSLVRNNLVITSRNMGNVNLEDDVLKIGYMFRSAMKSQIADLMDQTLIIADRFGALYVEDYRYSGFTTDGNTPLNNLWKEVYKEATGKDLTLLAIHGGTDVGTIVEGMNGMDVISIGPNTINVHRPGEALELASFDRTYGYLKTILSRL
ncbi:MAG: beta-Ala-His dipeptidase [Clostridia bacterium]